MQVYDGPDPAVATLVALRSCMSPIGPLRGKLENVDDADLDFHQGCLDQVHLDVDLEDAIPPGKRGSQPSSGVISARPISM